MNPVHRLTTAATIDSPSYRALFEAAPAALVVTRADGTIVLINQRAAEVFGIGAETLRGQSISLLFSGEAADAGGVQARMGWEVKARRGDGSAFPAKVEIERVETAGGVLICRSVQDITLQKKEEEEARGQRSPRRFAPGLAEGTEQESWLRQAQAIAHLGSFRWDRTRNTAVYSEELYRIFGLDPNEPITLEKYLSLVHPDHRERTAAIIQTAIRSGQAFEHEYRIVRPDGQERWLFARGEPIQDDHGRVLGLQGICHDITERKRSEAALLASDERFRYVTLATRDAIYDWTVETGAVWRNENYRQLYSAHEPMGDDERWWEEHVHPEDRQRVLGTLAEALALRSQVWTGEYRFRRHDGSYARVIDRGYILYSPQGKPWRMIGAMTDVSEFKRLEEQFLQAQKMEAVGRLAGGVAHDFNNLLTTILGHCELLMGAMPGPERAAVEEIQKSGQRAAALTQQLLAFSRKQLLQPQLLDLGVIVGDISTMLRRLIGEDIRLELELADGLWPVKADPGQMQQVILNLAVNARDAMPDGGTLRLGTANVELDEEFLRSHQGARPGAHVRLTIADTGVGMTAEVKRRLFEPFFTTKGLGKGTGLGLATVYGIVKQSGGYIGVESEPGQGATFTILLPREAGVPQEPARDPAEPRDCRGTETVLLVEDEEGVRRLAQRALESSGYRVLAARDGEEALAQAARHDGPLHALVTDLVMPGMNGSELAERLRQVRPGIKVLYMSGYAEDVLVRHNVAVSDLAFLQKPFGKRELALKVRAVLDR
jgi:two-component system cell cycle sensor histidine kinase/response regulator CckA